MQSFIFKAIFFLIEKENKKIISSIPVPWIPPGQKLLKPENPQC